MSLHVNVVQKSEIDCKSESKHVQTAHYSRFSFAIYFHLSGQCSYSKLVAHNRHVVVGIECNRVQCSSIDIILEL